MEYPPPAYLIRERTPRTSRHLPRMSRTWSSNTPNRDSLNLRLVLFLETPTESPKSDSYLDRKSKESSRKTDWPQRSLRIFTTWSKRPSPSESIWRKTETTRTPNTDLLSRSPESTESQDTTERPEKSQPTSSTTSRLSELWSLRPK